MQSLKTVIQVAHDYSPQDFSTFAAPDSSYTKFYVEDGWVFREHHGKHIECIARCQEFRGLTGLPPNAARLPKL